MKDKELMAAIEGGRERPRARDRNLGGVLVSAVSGHYRNLHAAELFPVPTGVAVVKSQRSAVLAGILWGLGKNTGSARSKCTRVRVSFPRAGRE